MAGMGMGMAAQAAPQQAMPAQAQAQPAQPRNVSDPADGQPNVSPEEQAEYDKFVQNAYELIYPSDGSEQVSPAIIQHLQGQFEPEVEQVFGSVEPPLGETPTDNLAGTCVMIVLMLEASAQSAGAQVLDEVVFHAGVEIMENLADVAEAANIYDYTEQDQEAALYRAVDLYRQTSSRIDPESLKAEFEQIRQADADGQMDQLIPGMATKGA